MELFAIVVLHLACFASFALHRGTAAIFDVTTFNAVGDGTTDDTKAFEEAWAAVCGDSSATPVMIIPSGKTFLLRPIKFKGPCNGPQIYMKVEGDIVGPSTIDAWTGCAGKSETVNFWIYFYDVGGLVIEGSGHFDGRGSLWWHQSVSTSSCKHPRALQFEKCNGLRLSGTNHINSPMAHIGIGDSNDVDIGHIHISAPHDSPNTDGIDIGGSAHVSVHDSSIQTGDDCVAINGGSSDINVTEVACGPGHGISIGSLGKAGHYDTVEDVHVRQCNISDTTNGLRIKTIPGGSGYAKNIHFEHILLTNVKNPIIIDQHYCLSKHCPPSKSAVGVSHVTYKNIQGSAATRVGIDLDCSDIVPCENLMMDNIDITGSDVTSKCNNAHGTFAGISPAVSCA